MTNREKLQDDYENSVLALLMDDYARSEGERYIEINEQLKQDPDAAVPEDVERRALQLIEREFTKKNRKHSGGKALRLLARVAIAAVIAVMLFTAAFALSSSFRSGTLNLLMQIDSRVASWQFVPEGAEGYDVPNNEINIEVTWLPDGYQQGPRSISGPYDLILDCTNNAGELIRVSVHVNPNGIHTLDLEDADYYADITVQDCNGMIIKKDDIIRIDWAYNNTELVVCVESQDVDIATLINVAESVSIIG